MSFYDKYLKGIAPAVRYPAYSVQDSTGTWRAQDTWPVVDGSATVELGGGSYVDDGGRNSYLTWSGPLERATRVTGTPRVSLNAEGRGNVVVKLHDVAPDGTAVMFDEQVSLLGSGETAFDLGSTDWTLAAGHSLVVEIGTIAPETGPLDPAFGPGRDWLGTPSGETVEVTGARLDLALDDPADDTPTGGARAPYLDVYLGARTTNVPVGPATFAMPLADR